MQINKTIKYTKHKLNKKSKKNIEIIKKHKIIMKGGGNSLPNNKVNYYSNSNSNRSWMSNFPTTNLNSNTNPNLNSNPNHNLNSKTNPNLNSNYNSKTNSKPNSTTTPSSNSSSSHINRPSPRLNFSPTNTNGRAIYKNIYSDKVKNILKNINKKLVDMCDDQLSIMLDYRHKLPDTPTTRFNMMSKDLILCLYRKCKAISTIVLYLDYESKTIYINSTTIPQYEGLKYNTLLCAIVIYLSKLLFPKLKYIKAHCVNPLSAYILIMYLNAIPYKTYNNEIPYKTYNNDNLSTIESFKEQLNTIKLNKETAYTNLMLLLEQYNTNDAPEIKFDVYVSIDVNSDNINKTKKYIYDILLNKNTDNDFLYDGSVLNNVQFFDKKKQYITCIKN